MKDDFSILEAQTARLIVAELTNGDPSQAIVALRELKDTSYAAIPPHQRISRGITWVMKRISRLFVSVCSGPEEIASVARLLSTHLVADDLLMGVPIFMMGEYGKTAPTKTFELFIKTADSPDWVVREFAQSGFRMLIKPNREITMPWLKVLACSPNPNLRRFVGETLRPVVDNQWLQKEPQTSLEILRLMFKEAHNYPRTSVGNNLSDLSRRNSDLILEIVKELVASQDPNSYWIAYRACRNLVKRFPEKVMDLLRVVEYHYKDRNYYLG